MFQTCAVRRIPSSPILDRVMESGGCVRAMRPASSPAARGWLGAVVQRAGRGKASLGGQGEQGWKRNGGGGRCVGAGCGRGERHQCGVWELSGLLKPVAPQGHPGAILVAPRCPGPCWGSRRTAGKEGCSSFPFLFLLSLRSFPTWMILRVYLGPWFSGWQWWQGDGWTRWSWRSLPTLMVLWQGKGVRCTFDFCYMGRNENGRFNSATV